MTRWSDDDLDELVCIVAELAAGLWVIEGGDHRLALSTRATNLKKRKQKERLDGKANDHG